MRACALLMPGQGQSQSNPNTTWRVTCPSTWAGQPKRQVSSLGRWARLTPWAATPKLKVIIFSLTITSMSNASHRKYSPTPLSLPLQLFIARARLPLQYFNPQCSESSQTVRGALSSFSILCNLIL